MMVNWPKNVNKIKLYIYGVWLKPWTILFTFSLITQHDVMCKKITISLKDPECDKIHVSSLSIITSKRAPTHYLLHTFLTYVTPIHPDCLCVCILLNVYIMYFTVDHSFCIKFMWFWPWGLCVRFAGCCLQTGHTTPSSTPYRQLENQSTKYDRQQPLV